MIFSRSPLLKKYRLFQIPYGGKPSGAVSVLLDGPLTVAPRGLFFSLSISFIIVKRGLTGGMILKIGGVKL
jgi:hypothetical protein